MFNVRSKTDGARGQKWRPKTENWRKEKLTRKLSKADKPAR